MTTLSLWNKVHQGAGKGQGHQTFPIDINTRSASSSFLTGIIVAGYGNGYIRIFSVHGGEVKELT